MVAAAWWLGNIKVSAITTFSLRPAANTMVSAMSSGVKGSQPLLKISIRTICSQNLGITYAYTASAFDLSPPNLTTENSVST